MASAMTTIVDSPATKKVIEQRWEQRGVENVLTTGFAHSRTVINNLVTRELAFF